MPMRRNGNPEDATYAREARVFLGLNQPDFAARLGLSQSGLSHIENEWSPLSLLQRREIERMIARRQALSILNDQNGWFNGVAPCPEADRLADEDAEALIDHAERCPTCLARAALFIPSPVSVAAS